jgi:hypothetical protein
MNHRFILFLVTIIFSATIVSIGQQQPQNPGFEEWEDVGIHPDTLEPVNWSSLKTSDGGELINGAIPVVWFQSTDAHSGMYSIKLENKSILTLVAPGTLTNGRVHAALPPSDAYVYTIDSVPDWNTPFTDFPDSLSIWAKFFPEENDIAHVIAVLHTDTAKVADSTQTNWVAIASIDISDEVSEWTQFSVPFDYLNNDTPEYILFAIYSGDAENALAGSKMYLDDFELIYHETDIPTNTKENINLYFSNNLLVANLLNTNVKEECEIEIIDLSGKILFSKQINPNEINYIYLNIPVGIYVCNIHNKTINYSQKIIKK